MRWSDQVGDVQAEKILEEVRQLVEVLAGLEAIAGTRLDQRLKDTELALGCARLE